MSALALPLVDSQALRLRAGHADRGPTHLLHFFDLDVTVTEDEQLTARSWPTPDTNCRTNSAFEKLCRSS